MTATAHIALGSNLGNRLELLQSAINTLHNHDDISVERVSSVFESPAHVRPGSPAQPSYLNAVALITTVLDPEELLKACLQIETQHGRIRTNEASWEARTLDLDLLNWDQLAFSSDRLQLPHPRIDERRFVLLPFSEIDPNLKLPSPYNRSVEYLLSHCVDMVPTTKTSIVLTIPRRG